MKPATRGPAISPAFCAIGILAAFCAAGCGSGRSTKTVMSEKLRTAVQEARSGTSFLESQLSAHTMTSDELKAAKDYIVEHTDSSAYILLMALRKDAPGIYAEVPSEVKAQVLCAALAKVTFLNDFGVLGPSGSHDGEAGKALLETGESGIGCLRTLLGDKGDAPLFGSKDATVSSVYRYRRADFVYRYIMLMRGREPTFPADPAERDMLIGKLRKEVGVPGT